MIVNKKKKKAKPKITIEILPWGSLSSDVVLDSWDVGVVATTGEGATAGVEGAGVGVDVGGLALGVDENGGLKPFILRWSVLAGSKLTTSKPTVCVQLYNFWCRICC